MAIRRMRALRKSIERTLLTRDRLEIKAVERVLALAHLEPRGPRVRARPKTRRPAR